MRSILKYTAALTIGSMVSGALGQGIVRAMADNRSGGISVGANIPPSDPHEASYSVVPGQNDFDPFSFFFEEGDARTNCSFTNAFATLTHRSQFTNLVAGNVCRGFRSRTSGSGLVNVSPCGAGDPTFANLGDNVSQVLRIENAPANGQPMRVMGSAGAAGGASVQVRIIRPNGTDLLNLTSGFVNSVVNLSNGDYTITGGISNGNASLTTVGSSNRSASWSVGFWKECSGDLNGDGTITLDDLAVLLSAFGANNQGDVDLNGVTDIQDLAFLLAAFGTTCTN